MSLKGSKYFILAALARLSSRTLFTEINGRDTVGSDSSREDLRQRTRKGEKGMNIYVGDLSYDATEDDLRRAFEDFGQVASVKIIMDRYTGRSRGFGFVEMTVDDEGKAAITGLHGKDLKGRPIKVNEARPRSDDRRGGGGRRSF